MNIETNNIVVYITGEFDFENEIFLQSSKNEGNSTAGELDIKTLTDTAKTLVQEERYDDFGQLVQQINAQGIFRRQMEDEEFLVMYLKYKLHQGHYQDIFHILENVENTSDPIFIELWDEAHYRHYFAQHGGILTSTNKFRIRQRNPPPPRICPGGIRPAFRLTESSVSVLREWYNAHSTDPYPCRNAKQALAQRAGIPLTKVNSWFANARRRHKKELQKLNKKSGKKIGTVNYTSKYVKNKQKLDLVNKSKETEEEGKTDTDERVVNVGKSSKIYLANENSNCFDNLCKVTLDHPNMKSSENSRQSQSSEVLFNDENVGDLPQLCSHSRATVYTFYKQNGSKTDGLSEYVIPNQRGPFSEVPRRDNEQSEKRNILFGDELKPDEQNDNTAYENINNEYPQGTIQNSILKTPVYSYVYHPVLQTFQVPSCKGKTVHQVNKCHENPKVVDVNEDTFHKNAKKCMYADYRQTRPKLKSEGKHTEIKIKDIKSVWKLRVLLTEKQKQKGAAGLKEKGNKGIGITASDCLKSLQKLCENVETGVESPVDYACKVEFEECKEDSEEETVVNEHIVGTQNDVNFVEDTIPVIRTSNVKAEGFADRIFDDGNGSQMIGWAESVIPISSCPTVWMSGPHTLGSQLVQTGVDLSTGSKQNVTDIRSGESTNFENLQQYPHRDQVVPSSSDVYNNHSSSATGNQYFRSQGTDWQNPWPSWCGDSSQDVVSRQLLEANNIEDYHSVVRDSGSYGTVVGEAIQGLLNLSSSQESDCNCFD